MNIQFLVALQEFVQEVDSVVNTTSERGHEHPDLNDKMLAVDSMCEAMIMAEKAKQKILEDNT